MSAFIARYPASCHADCGEPIWPGDEVTYVDMLLVHAACADDFGPLPEPRAIHVCPTCHLVKPCDCEES